MFSGIWRKAKKKNMKKERKFGLKEFPRPLQIRNGGNDERFRLRQDRNAYSSGSKGKRLVTG